MLIISIVHFSAILLLLIEKLSINNSINKIQNRIHINGTRGKSSVTEYIAAGLSEEGQNTLAKITGITPEIIFNGKRILIERKGKARVQEQFKIIHLAANKASKNLVLECMSVSPALQQLESRIFKAHIYIITNIRDDHREEYGSNPEQQAEAICSAVPSNSLVITGEKRYQDKILFHAKNKGSKVQIIENSYVEELRSELPDGVFAENVALALSTCRALNVDVKNAKQRILDYISINNKYLHVLDKQRDIHFLNGFAVNDIESADAFLKYWLKKISNKNKIAILFNTRSDRPFRTDLFSNWIGTISNVDKIFIMGNHSQRGKKILVKSGLDKEKIQIFKTKKNMRFKESILADIDDETLIFAVGNIAGKGLSILQELK